MSNLDTGPYFPPQLSVGARVWSVYGYHELAVSKLNRNQAPRKGLDKTGVGKSIAGKFQWVSLANFPLGTESQRCQSILR